MGTTISGDTGITFPDATTQSKAVSQTTPFAVTASATTGAQLNLPEGTNNGAHFVALKAPDVLAADTTFTLPAADGTNGQYLQTNGAGSLAFATVPTTAPGGTTGQVQYNNAGAFGGLSSGTSGQVLTSAGAGAAPTWATVSSGINGDPRTVLTSKVVSYGVASTTFVGTIALGATTQMIVVSDTSGNYYASVYDSSTDTMGSVVTIASGTNTDLRSYPISSTSALIAFTASTTLFVCILSVSGTTITVNTSASSASAGSYIVSDPLLLGSTYAFCVATGAAVASSVRIIAATVSGATVTLGSGVTGDAARIGNTIMLVPYSSTQGFVLYRSDSLAQHYCFGFTVSGTTVTASSPIVVAANTNPASNGSMGYFKLSSGRVMAVNYCSTYIGFNLISMSGATPTASQIGGPNISSNFYMVQSGDSVLFVGTSSLTSANAAVSCVAYDNAGVAAISATTGSLNYLPNSVSRWSIYPTSATTIGASNGNYFYNVSISGNAPALAYNYNSIAGNAGVGGVNPTRNIMPVAYVSGSSRTLKAAGGAYGDFITGVSGSIYPLNAGGGVTVKSTASGEITWCMMNNAYAVAYDSCSTSCAWVAEPSGGIPTVATSLLLRRVQFS